MITVKEQLTQQKVFEAVRGMIQEIHSEAVFADDVCGSPFLFKSTDARVWVRVFYRPMTDSSPNELVSELARLRMIMPKDALVYLFYPALDQEQMAKCRNFGDRVTFFEYGSRLNDRADMSEIKVRRWVPASAQEETVSKVRAVTARRSKPVPFLNYTRLSQNELAELTELGLSLRREKTSFQQP